MILCPLPSRPYFRITQRFGENPDIYKQFGLDGHSGCDFAPFIPGDRNYVVYSPHEGYVITGNERDKGYGLFVRITSRPYIIDGTSRQSVLAHLKTILVSTGQYIAAGEPIGIMGNTGFSTATHLHFGYRLLKDGAVVDFNNGYLGYKDVLKYLVQWTTNPLS